MIGETFGSETEHGGIAGFGVDGQPNLPNACPVRGKKFGRSAHFCLNLRNGQFERIEGDADSKSIELKVRFGEGERRTVLN